ncbi:hypothetical protein HGRIS_012415 [Hohenbuehelia grisea]|uniref:Uncharacterized protein n=1 Tax=Hohenbuehelia grisea TaxID=104357 RepID=A0ABR3ISA4_9AGAR
MAHVADAYPVARIWLLKTNSLIAISVIYPHSPSFAISACIKMLGSMLSSSQFSAGNYVPAHPQDWMPHAASADAARPLSPVGGVWLYGGPSPSPSFSRPCYPTSLPPLSPPSYLPRLSVLSETSPVPPPVPPKDHPPSLSEPPQSKRPSPVSPLSMNAPSHQPLFITPPSSSRSSLAMDRMSDTTTVEDVDDDDAATIVGVPSSPILPDSPEIPSPNTLRQRRMSKLRRQLGEDVPPELVSCPPSRAGTPVFGELDKAIDLPDDMEDLFARSKSKMSYAGSEGAESDDESVGEDMDWSALAQTARMRLEAGQHARKKRFNTRTLLDKGGRRREETNWSDVLKQLRAL